MQRIFRRHKNQQATEQKKTKKTEKNALSSRLNIHLQAYEEHAASFNVISSSGEIDYQATAESMCASLKAFLQENKAMHNAYSIELEKLIDVINGSTLKNLNYLNFFKDISSLHLAIAKELQDPLLNQEKINDLQRRYEELKPLLKGEDYRRCSLALINTKRRLNEVPELIEKFKTRTHAGERDTTLNPVQEIALNKVIECHAVIANPILSAVEVKEKIRLFDLENAVNTATPTATTARAKLAFHAPAKPQPLPSAEASTTSHRVNPTGG